MVVAVLIMLFLLLLLPVSNFDFSSTMSSGFVEDTASTDDDFSSFKSFNWLMDFLSCLLDSLRVKFSLFVVRWPKPWNFDLFNKPRLENIEEATESKEVFSQLSG